MRIEAGEAELAASTAEVAVIGVRACISAHSASYVLYDGKDAYTLSDQEAPEKFAGQKVTVVGALDANTKTIKVESITAAN